MRYGTPSAVVLASVLLAACPPPVDDDDDAIFGDGSHSLDSIELTVVADSGDDLDVPRDLEFHPDRPGELWIVNRGDESVTVLFDAGTPDQESQNFWGPEGAHFLAQPSALAFSDNGNFATVHETDDPTPFSGGAPGDFMGPTLWTSDFDIFDAAHQGHIDMLHNSPNGMGVAWDEGNAFWVFDGYHDSLTWYDFHDDHGPGGADHSDGELLRYAEGEVARDSDVPSHLALDRETGLLYVADTGNGRIAVLDTRSGDVGDTIAPNHDGSDQRAVEGATLRTLVDGETVNLAAPSGIALRDGVLYVSDNRGGVLFAFDLEGTMLDWIDLERETGGLMGMAFDEQGRLHVVDAEAEEILRIDPLASPGEG